TQAPSCKIWQWLRPDWHAVARPGLRSPEHAGDGLQGADGTGAVASSRLPRGIERHHQARRYKTVPGAVEVISFRLRSFVDSATMHGSVSWIDEAVESMQVVGKPVTA